MRDYQHGISLLEFTLVVLIISVLGAVLLNALTRLRVEVERVAIQQTVNQMRSALGVRFVELYIDGDEEAITDWAGGNALSLLREGVDLREPVTGSETEVSGPGEWSYEDGEIVYRPVFPEALSGDPEAVGRWRVVIRGSPENPRGLDLRTIDPLLGHDNLQNQEAE